MEVRKRNVAGSRPAAIPMPEVNLAPSSFPRRVSLFIRKGLSRRRIMLGGIVCAVACLLLSAVILITVVFEGSVGGTELSTTGRRVPEPTPRLSDGQDMVEDLAELRQLLTVIERQVPSGLAHLARFIAEEEAKGSAGATSTVRMRSSLADDLRGLARAGGKGFRRATGFGAPEEESPVPYDDVHFLAARHAIHTGAEPCAASSCGTAYRSRLYGESSVFNRRFYYPVRRYAREFPYAAASVAEVEAWHLPLSLSSALLFGSSGLGDRVASLDALRVERSNPRREQELENYFSASRAPYFEKAQRLDDEATIFVNVASYRDTECSSTLLDMLGVAKAPERIFIGIAEQNHFSTDPPCLARQLHKPTLCYSPLEDFSRSHPDAAREGRAAQRVIRDAAALPHEGRLRDFSRGVCFFNENIRIRRVSFDHAMGPAVGRYMAMLLYGGESLALVTDSHARFIPMWDTFAAYMWSRYDDKKAFLTHYPEAYQEGNNFVFFRSSTAYLCQSYMLDNSGYVRHNGIILSNPSSVRNNHFNDPFVKLQSKDIDQSTNFRLPQPYLAGGFSFSSASIYREVPFDPHLRHIFDGEEVLLAVRLWTNGYNLYTPYRNVEYHMYGRPKAPKVWTDSSSVFYATQRKVVPRIQFLLRALKAQTHTLMVPPDTDTDPVVMDIDRFGMGRQRTVAQWYDYAGVDPSNRTVDGRWCGKYEKKK